VQKIPFLHDNLARFESQVPKSGGSLLTMAGVVYLPQILEMMSQHINYQWTISYHMPVKSLQVWHRKMQLETYSAVCERKVRSKEIG
jgi:hypothetical protein